MEGPTLHHMVGESPQDMQAIRSELKESGVIGEVVNDFLPHMQLYVQFGNKRISLGEYLSPADVQRQPDAIEIEHENLALMNSLENSRFVLAMTEPHTCCESLHWLITNFVSHRGTTACSSPRENTGWNRNTLAAYEPPRSTDTHMIVFTLFKENQYRPEITQPVSRNIFSTRGFVGSNDLGPPLGVAFCYIKNETDDQNDSDESINSALDGHGAIRTTMNERKEISGDLELCLNNIVQ